MIKETKTIQILKVLSFTGAFMLAGFLFVSPVHAFTSPHLTQTSFQQGSVSNITVLGQFQGPLLDFPDCNWPYGDPENAIGHYEVDVQNLTFTIKNSSGNVVYSSGNLNTGTGDYDLDPTSQGRTAECADFSESSSPQGYNFTGLTQIPVGSLAAGNYSVNFFELDGAYPDPCADDPYYNFNDCGGTNPSSYWSPLNFTVTAPTSPGTINVTSNQPTSWTVNGPSIFPCSSSCTFQSYSNATPGTYSISTNPVTCYGNPSVQANPGNQVLSSNGTLSYTLTYSDDGSCGSPTSSMQVNFAGSGGGNVTSNPVGLNCNNGCSASFTTGTQITFTATPNGSSVFTGWGAGVCNGFGTGQCTITLDSNQATVVQFDAQSCTYSISPTSQSIGSSGGTGSVTVTASGSTCTWNATSNNPSFITVTSGSSGTGSGTVNYSVAANAGSARSGTITIAGKTFTINQSAAPACTYSIAPTSQSFAASGGTGSVTVTASSGGCLWTAASNIGFITITAGSSGTGSGSVNYSVASNAGSTRSGTMTIAGQTFTVTQSAAGGSTITYTITYTPTTLQPPVMGGTSGGNPIPALDNSTCSKVTVNWTYTLTGAEDGFYVYRSTDDATWGSSISGLLSTATRSYQDTPPATNTTYYYRVSVHRALPISPTEVFSQAPDPSVVNVPCTGDLSPSTMILSKVNGATYSSSSTAIKSGDTLTYQITLINPGPANITIDNICNNPSSNLSAPRNLAVTGVGSVNGGVQLNNSTCTTNSYSGINLNATGTKDVLDNWIITFDTTYTPTTTGSSEEQITNNAVIFYHDITSKRKSVTAQTVLVTNTQSEGPTFREVAP